MTNFMNQITKILVKKLFHSDHIVYNSGYEHKFYALIYVNWTLYALFNSHKFISVCFVHCRHFPLKRSHQIHAQSS